jgi:ribosome-associated protein
MVLENAEPLPEEGDGAGTEPGWEGSALAGIDPRASVLDLARFAAQALDEKKLQDIAIFDVRATLQIVDYFVIATGLSPRQIKAAADFLDKELGQRGVRRLGIEGYATGNWLLLDYDFVVVHVFLAEQRRFYDLELLWGDSPAVAWRPAPPATAR